MAIVGLATATGKLCRRARKTLRSPLAPLGDGGRPPGSRAQAWSLDDEPIIAALIVRIGENEAFCSMHKPSWFSGEPFFCVRQPAKRGGEAFCSIGVTANCPGKGERFARKAKKAAGKGINTSRQAAGPRGGAGRTTRARAS